MQTHPSPIPREPNAGALDRWGIALFALIGLVTASTVFSLLRALVGDDFLVAVNTAAGPVSLTEKDLTTVQRWLLVAVMAFPPALWLAGVLSLAKVPLAIRRGDNLERAVIVALRRFGWCLAAMTAAEAILLPAASGLLVWFGKSGPIENAWANTLTGDMWDSAMAASLVVILSHVIESGAAAREELRLTV